jgi:hypothetical protein
MKNNEREPRERMSHLQVLKAKATKLRDDITRMDDILLTAKLTTSEFLDEVRKRREASYQFQLAKRKIHNLETGKPLYGINETAGITIYPEKFGR